MILLKTKKDLQIDVGLTQQSANMHYLGLTYINLIRGRYIALDLLIFGFYIQMVWPYRKPSHPELVK